MSAPTLSVIGLTGGIASGKSTVAERLKAHGVPVIDADQVAREVVEPGEAALVAIAGRFGAGVLRADGALDRKALGGIVFADLGALADLNAITHPAIMNRVGVHTRALAQQGHGWAVYEAALIVEHDLSPHLSQLIAVICDPEVQVTRIMARDHLSEAEARLRLAAQTDNATRVARADVILRNDGSLDVLLEATDALVEALKAHYQG